MVPKYYQSIYGLIVQCRTANCYMANLLRWLNMKKYGICAHDIFGLRYTESRCESISNLLPYSHYLLTWCSWSHMHNNYNNITFIQNISRKYLYIILAWYYIANIATHQVHSMFLYSPLHSHRRRSRSHHYTCLHYSKAGFHSRLCLGDNMKSITSCFIDQFQVTHMMQYSVMS